MSNSAGDGQVIGTGVYIRELRHRVGKTLRSVADEIGCSVSVLSEMETGAGIPNASFILALSRALECHPDQLLGWREPYIHRLLWFHYRQLQSYYIESLTKHVKIDLRGTARIRQEICGIHNESSEFLRLQHRVFFDRMSDDAVKEFAQSAIFEWTQTPQTRPLDESIPPLFEKSTLVRASFNPRFPPESGPYSYTMEYQCQGTFCMTDDQLAKKSDENPMFISDRDHSASERTIVAQGTHSQYEWSQFFTEKPVKQLILQVEFPSGYLPRDMHCFAWKGDFIQRPDASGVPSTGGILSLPDHIGSVDFDRKARVYRVEISYPVQGFSYALVWIPMAENDFGFAFH